MKFLKFTLKNGTSPILVNLEAVKDIIPSLHGGCYITPIAEPDGGYAVTDTFEEIHERIKSLQPSNQ